MSGITIGVFSVIGVMTAVSALRAQSRPASAFSAPRSSSSPSGRRSRSTATTGTSTPPGRISRSTRPAATRTSWWGLPTSYACPPLNGISRAGHIRRPQDNTGHKFWGSDENFLTANRYTIETGRNFTGADIDLVRPVAIIGPEIVSKLYPSETPLGKLVKAHGRTYTVIGTFAARGPHLDRARTTTWSCPSPVSDDFGAQHYTVDIATQAPSS